MADDLELLTRRGCHLCEDAIAMLRSGGWHPVEIDIDLDPALLGEFDHRVPVVRRRTTGEIIAEGVITDEILRLLANS